MKTLSNVKNRSKLSIGCSIDGVIGGGLKKDALPSFMDLQDLEKQILCSKCWFNAQKMGKKQF